MIRFILRFLALVALAVAVVMAVVDATKSVAASAFTPTPLGESWLAVSADSLIAARQMVEQHAWPVLWDPVATTVLALPGFVVFAVLAFLLYAAGHRPARRRRARTAGI